MFWGEYSHERHTNGTSCRGLLLFGLRLDAQSKWSTAVVDRVAGAVEVSLSTRVPVRGRWMMGNFCLTRPAPLLDHREGCALVQPRRDPYRAVNQVASPIAVIACQRRVEMLCPVESKLKS